MHHLIIRGDPDIRKDAVIEYDGEELVCFGINVRAVPAALNVDTETDQLLAVVLDHRVLPDVGVAADDEVVHTSGFACSGLNRFDTADRIAGPPRASGRRTAGARRHPE